MFLFSGLAINAVSRAAGRVVFEVREQFRTKPGIMDYTEKPDYARVVDICTKDSLRELATPGLLAVLSPIAVGFALGYAPLGAFLAGAIACGVLMAVFLANSGGAWDNAKKLVEDGNHGGKGSPAHEATIIGDTVGDPFKDTAGPALNPLLKVMNLVALLIAPTVVKYSIGVDESDAVRALVAGLAIVGHRGRCHDQQPALGRRCQRGHREGLRQLGRQHRTAGPVSSRGRALRRLAAWRERAHKRTGRSSPVLERPHHEDFAAHARRCSPFPPSR